MQFLSYSQELVLVSFLSSELKKLEKEKNIEFLAFNEGFSSIILIYAWTASKNISFF